MMAGVIVVLAALVAAFVLAPLAARPRPHACSPAGSPRRPGDSMNPPLKGTEGAVSERLAREGAAISQTLRDLDLDRATGKINDADYAELAAQYRARALAVLDGRAADPPLADEQPGGPAHQ